ncbi:hypothetical protein KW882_00020 [Vibrio parahaemolyticus]
MILITKIFQEQFRQVKKRLTESGFNIVPLHGYKAKKVELNYYTSYTTLGVEADHLRLITHEDDSSEIQKAKKKEIWESNRAINLKAVTLPLGHASIGFNFFYKELEEPYIRVTARLKGMPYPNLIASPPFTPNELKELFKYVLKGEETGEDFINKMIETFVLNHSSHLANKQTELQNKESASKAQFEKFCEKTYSGFLSLSFDREKVEEEVSKFETTYSEKIAATEEFNEVKRLEKELELARAKLRDRGSEIKHSMLSENHYVKLVLERRKVSEDTVLQNIRSLYNHHKSLPLADQSFTKSTLSQTVKKIVDNYNSYAEYPLSDFSIDWILREYSIKIR